MEIILLERIEKLGTIGDVVTVKDGYARNFLLPNKKALRANEANRKVFEANREDRGRQRRAPLGRRKHAGNVEGKSVADPRLVERRPALRFGRCATSSMR
jgi:large subunit ribosomal protein L9